MQLSFFDDPYLLARLTELGDPLVSLSESIDFEIFRSELEVIRNRPKKNNAGAKGYDVILLFKMLMIQKLNNLSDAQTEFLCTDRSSFRRFLGLSLVDKIPDQNTIWVFRESLKKLNLVEKLFERLLNTLKNGGVEVKTGQLVDASFVQAPRQRNNREENKAIKAGEKPEAWEEKSDGFLRQKDVDARWTKKNNETYYGYKDHVNVDQRTKIISKYSVTSAEVHDSQELSDILHEAEEGWSARPLYADSAYRGEESEKMLRSKGVPSMVHEKAYKNNPLKEEQKIANTEKSRIRSRVEHVFATIKQMSGDYVRTIGIKRASVHIGLVNLAYNLKRSVWLAKIGVFKKMNANIRVITPKFA